MLREQLKSKLHRAIITDGNINYEGSISIPADLMEEIDIWPGEKVLVASITAGGRLETYVQQGKAGTGQIVMNGGAAHIIHTGERVTIQAYALSDKAIKAKILICDENNKIIGRRGF